MKKKPLKKRIKKQTEKTIPFCDLPIVRLARAQEMEGYIEGIFG
jgi:hypothetical protein